MQRWVPQGCWVGQEESWGRLRGVLGSLCTVSDGEKGSGATGQPRSGEKHQPLKDGREQEGRVPQKREAPPGKGAGGEAHPEQEDSSSRRRLGPMVNAAEGKVTLENHPYLGMRRSHVTSERAVSG